MLIFFYLFFLNLHYNPRTIGDEVGEAKASGNLGNTLKLLGRYDEAVVCCQRHLEITRAIYDKVGNVLFIISTQAEHPPAVFYFSNIRLNYFHCFVI